MWQKIHLSSAFVDRKHSLKVIVVPPSNFLWAIILLLWGDSYLSLSLSLCLSLSLSLSLSFKFIHSWHLFPLSSSLQCICQYAYIKFADEWIRTVDLWCCTKQLLYNVSKIPQSGLTNCDQLDETAYNKFYLVNGRDRVIIQNEMEKHLIWNKKVLTECEQNGIGAWPNFIFMCFFEYTLKYLINRAIWCDTI